MRSYKQQRREFIELAIKIIELGNKGNLGVFSDHMPSATFDYGPIQFFIKESWREEHNEKQIQELWKVYDFNLRRKQNDQISNRNFIKVS